MDALAAKTAIVTGASTGIGRATADALAQAGFRVFGTSRRPSTNGSRSVSILTCDITDDVAVSSFVSSVLDQTGRIDVLVNNAGMGLLGAAEESSIGQIQKLFDVNLFGAIRMTNAVLPVMRQQGAGRIVNISSLFGLIPGPYTAHYAATKHALEGYSESLDHETRAFNVRVALVEPSYTSSSFELNTLSADRTLKEYDEARAGARALLKESVAIGDTPISVAETVVAAATAKKPRRRYPAGKTARQISMLRRFVPATAFEKSLRKQMRLPA